MTTEEKRKKKLLELDSTIKMLDNTLRVTLNNEKSSKSTWDKILAEKEEVKKLKTFVEGLNDDDFEIFYNYPIDLVHRVFQDCSADSDIEVYKKIFNLYKNDKTVHTNMISASKAVLIEPSRRNEFLVILPEYYNISVNEIVSFHYGIEGRLSVTVRESLGKKQIKKIVDELNAKQEHPDDPKPYQEIKYIQLTPDLKVDYVHIFKDVSLEYFAESESTYKIPEGGDNLKYFQMMFSFKKHEILEEDETTDKKEDNK